MTLTNKIKDYMFYTTANSAALYGLSEIADILPDLSNQTNACLAGLSTVGLIGLNKYVIKPLAKKYSNWKPKIKGRGLLGETAKIIALSSILAGSQHSLKDDLQSIKYDIQNNLFRKETFSRNNLSNQLQYQSIPNLEDLSDIKLASKNTVNGRIQRTLRWKKIYSGIEKKHGIPEGYLAGIIMQESYGDPLQPNSGNDGGLGLAHIQCTTGKELDLKVYGNCRKDSDKIHGRELKNLIERCNNNISCVAKYDDRANPIKNLNAAARYMLQGKNKHKDWKSGIQWFRGPGHVNKKVGKDYLNKVLKFRNSLINKRSLELAKVDFENRNNGKSFDEYIKAYHKTFK
jgi:hypothetical protein